MFEGRLPAHLQDRRAEGRRDAAGPRRSGSSRARSSRQVGMNAVAGRRADAMKMEPFRFDQMRPELLRRRRARPRHGHQRRLGVGQLPVDDHRVLRPGVLQRQGPRARPGVHPARGTTGCTRSGTPRTRRASSRSASRTSPTPSAAVAEIHRNAERGFTGVSMPERPHTHRAARRCASATTGTRSSRRASTPTPSSRCTSAARAAGR